MSKFAFLFGSQNSIIIIIITIVLIIINISSARPKANNSVAAAAAAARTLERALAEKIELSCSILLTQLRLTSQSLLRVSLDV